MEKSGCAFWIAGLIAVVFVAGLWYGGCGMLQDANRQLEDQIAAVGGVPVSAAQVQSAFDEQTAQFREQMGGLSPEFEVMFLSASLQQSLTQAATISLARSEGVDLSDEGIIKAVEGFLREQMEQQARGEMVEEGKLKEGASTEDFLVTFQKETGRSFDEAVETQLAVVRTNLANPVMRPQLEAFAANEGLKAKYEAQVQLSDEELRRYFETIEAEKFAVDPSLSEEEQRKEAERIAAEINAGLDYYAAAKKYSKETVMEGQEPGQNPVEYTFAQIRGDSDLSPLVATRQDMAVAIKTPTGFEVVRVKSIRTEVPEDFTERISEFRRQFTEEEAQARLANDVRRITESNQVSWQSPGWKLLWEVGRLQMQGPSDFTQAEAMYRPLIAEAQEIMDSDPLGSRAAALAQLGAITALSRLAEPGQQAQFRQEKIQALEALLRYSDSLTARIELARELMQARRGADAAQMLIIASRQNLPGAAGKRTFDEINSMAEELEQQKLISQDELGAIRKAQDEFRRLTAEQEKFEAEQKKMEEEARKRLEAEREQAERESQQQAEPAPVGN
ncbi:MAG: SurA N-terminal domain-containing protein [Fimbriimonadaceae bacterium]